MKATSKKSAKRMKRRAKRLAKSKAAEEAKQKAANLAASKEAGDTIRASEHHERPKPLVLPMYFVSTSNLYPVPDHSFCMLAGSSDGVSSVLHACRGG